MPGLTSGSGDNASLSVVPSSGDAEPISTRYPIRHGLKSATRLSICWARGNTLRVTFLCQPQHHESSSVEEGGKVVELNLSDGSNGEIGDVEWRRIVYGSVTPFALLQSRKNAVETLSKMDMDSSPFNSSEWSEHVMEYSKEIIFLLNNARSPSSPGIEDPRVLLKKFEEPTNLKAAWELMDIFYADRESRPWIPERLLDWLADYDCLFSGSYQTVHAKLVEFQKELVSLQTVEGDPHYWEVMSSALAVGWLDIVVKLLRLHGSYQFDQLGTRETENGLVEAVAVLISNMPRMRPDLAAEKLGECYKNKPDFVKAWEKWRAQITKLDCAAFWLHCDHHQTREGLKNMLQIMLGNANVLSNVTCHWLELCISHFLYVRPFTTGLESMYSLAQKCMQLKPVSSHHKLMGLLTGILGENTEVVLAECARSFGPWMITHAIELLTVGSTQAEILLHEERPELGDLSIEELHRLIYAQVLSSDALFWQIAPIYLVSCMKQGTGLLENLLHMQPVQHKSLLLKSVEVCRLYELDRVSSNLMKIAGVHDWKHGKKGSGVFWLQQAKDDVLLNRIAKQLFDFVGKSISDESFKQWEGLLELLGSESRTAGGLEFLNKYRDFRHSLQQVSNGVSNGVTTDAAQRAAEALVSMLKNPSTPQRFWLPLLYDSLKLLNWQERPLLNVAQTNLLLNKLQELSIARSRPDFSETDLPSEALSSVRLALATNLGRAILEE